MIDDFEERWRSLIAAGDYATREVDARSPIRMVFGLDALANPFFSVIVEEKPGLPRLHGAISVERRVRQDGKWTLNLVLNDSTLSDIFITLVVDLAAKCTAATTERDAMTSLLAEVGDWQRLLRPRNDRLSEERLRGLIAELWFGFASGHHGFDLDIVVASWDGPRGGYQDFRFPKPGPSYEVKALRASGDVVEISSEFQLEGENLRLAAVTLEESYGPGAMNLPELVSSIQVGLKEPEARVEFQRRFLEVGANLDDPWYRDQSYQATRLRVYDVKNDFPALRRADLPEALRATKYRLDLNFVEGFLSVDIPLATS
ncbi:PD-(D/E)XK motif protein [Nocardioides sp. J54]|uniref:PD-(D/E)XK motif protein n=1 Tax=Nocardioides sp. J54 TaxID=935866 RepID=UPI00048D71D6|nr:PD-(D/E)XK motif protein [Nocardioides sp. J54]